MKPNTIYFIDGHTEHLTDICFISEGFILFKSNDIIYAYRKQLMDKDIFETMNRNNPFICSLQSYLYQNEFYKSRFKLSDISNISLRLPSSILNVENEYYWKPCGIEKFTVSDELYFNAKHIKEGV